MKNQDLKRHSVNTKLLKLLFRDAVEGLPNRVAAATRKANHLSRVADETKMLLSCGLIVEPDSPATLRGLHVMGEALAGMFQAALAGDKDVAFSLDGESQFTTRGPVDESLVNAGDWIVGFVATVIARQENLSGFLCQVPTDLLRFSTTTGSEFTYLFVDTLKSFWLKKHDISKLIDKTFQSAEAAPKDKWVQYVGKALLTVLHSVLKEPATLETNITEALVKHKKFWTSSAELKRHNWGFFAYELCAIGAVAHDRGIFSKVQSDYLPTALITGDILKRAD